MIPNSAYALLASAAIPTGTVVMVLPMSLGGALVLLLAVLALSGAALWFLTTPAEPCRKPRARRELRPATALPLPPRA